MTNVSGLLELIPREEYDTSEFTRRLVEGLKDEILGGSVARFFRVDKKERIIDRKSVHLAFYISAGGRIGNVRSLDVVDNSYSELPLSDVEMLCFQRVDDELGGRYKVYVEKSAS